MLKVLFVCHGNICRSPISEFMMKDMVRKLGISEYFEIASAATSTEEIGNPVYPPARRILSEHGISCQGKTARQITRRDLSYYDYIVLMDSNNMRNLRWMFPNEDLYNVRMMLSRDVADPWYTGNFQATWDDCEEGINALIDEIREEYGI
ncbi:MAG: low molecular weight phosphotyrosine protein phosphatase [Clostridiales bacterium]|nr:low molecular weight phosphotyrosine protein phosphatase [Clostridiales bacterium]